ncbi:hypothetical protein BGZ46_006445 [Entomortierella lignicola]|nr:hypothetical protein BGZ46_006445 [Entomortierella lignicola]
MKSPSAMDIKSKQNQLRAQLPNECLYLIVEHLCLDLRALHNLLFVNKFFFHATIPYLYHNPLVTWEMNEVYPKYSTDRNKLFALYFVSFLQARLKNFLLNPGNIPRANVLLDRLLKLHGLKLTLEYQSSGLDMLDYINGLTIRTRSCREDNNGQQKDSPSRMTIDYSKFLCNLSPLHWRSVEFYWMVRLRTLPKDMRNDDNSFNDHISTENAVTMLPEVNTIDTELSEIGLEDSDSIDCNPFGEHSLDQQFEQIYTRTLHRNLVEMWLHYNFDSITFFDFNIAKAQTYLPFSMKMENIQVINISRPRVLFEQHLEDTILFIKQNRAAFPKKRAVDVQLDRSWCLFEDDGNFSLMDLDSYIANRKKYREVLFQCTKPAIAIYEAVRKPSMMQVTNIPDFYNHAQGIELESLREFSDEDSERTLHGEGPEREEFLKRCNNLRELRLAVENQGTLSWAADLVRNSNPSSSERLLKNLESLELWTNHSYNSAIQALNDAMFAFSTSLRSINLSVNKDYYDTWIPIVVRNTRTMNALQLHHLDSATTIGDWPLLLPQLKSIRINLSGAGSIKVGSFENCPNLESLEIFFGVTNTMDYRPNGVAPTSPPEPGELIDPRWAQMEMDLRQFPVWNLPKLKQLNLRGMAVVRFDFGSLRSMKNLESVILDVRQESLSELKLDDFIARMHDISYSQHTATSDDEQEQMSDSSESGSAKSRYSTELETACLDTPSTYFSSLDPISNWSLPRLKKLVLYGVPALGFEFKSLAGMQTLETLILDASRESFSGNRLDEYIASQHRTLIPRGSHGSFDYDTTTWASPELKTLCLKGPPSVLFYLDLLKLFPRLESVSIAHNKNHEVNRHSPFQSNGLAQRNKSRKDSKNQDDDVPYLESRLKKFMLLDSSSMSAQDTISLLTIYAPYLEELLMDRDELSNAQNGEKLFAAIKKADSINKKYATTNSNCRNNSTNSQTSKGVRQPLPGENFMILDCRHTLNKLQKKKLGLRQITSQDREILKRHRLRTYCLTDKCFVRLEDFDRLDRAVKDKIK